MALKAKNVRKAIRWVHIVFGLVIMCYIYSPFHQNQTFQIIMKFLIIPVITLTGLWIWQFRAFNKFLRIEDGI